MGPFLQSALPHARRRFCRLCLGGRAPELSRGHLQAINAGLRGEVSLRAQVNSGNNRAPYHAKSPADGVERLAVITLCVGMVLWRLQRQNQRARQRIELLAKVFGHSSEAILVADREHRIVEVNPAFVRQTGYAPSEIVGLPTGRLHAPLTTLNDIEAMHLTLAGTGLWRGELWGRTKEGRVYPKWVSVSVSVLRDADGEVTHHIANPIDVTEAKQAEDRIRHLAHHDAMTQLPNRVLLHGRLEQAMAATRRETGRLAMPFLDMDRFKDINDTLGQPVGDALLVEVGPAPACPGARQRHRGALGRR